MKKLLLLVIIFCLLFSFTGCGYLTGRTEEMVTDYNNRLEKTLLTYEMLKQEAEKNQESLVSFILGETKEFMGFSEIEDLNTVTVSSNSHIVIRKDYFTALDATALREVLLLQGEDLVYVEVIWGTDGIISITRRVV